MSSLFFSIIYKSNIYVYSKCPRPGGHVKNSGEKGWVLGVVVSTVCMKDYIKYLTNRKVCVIICIIMHICILSFYSLL